MITAEEAFLVLEKLHSERAVVGVLGYLYGWSFSCKGRIDRLSREEVSLVSLDGMAGFEIELLRDDMLFEYGEPGHMSLPKGVNVPETALRAAALTIGLPFRVTPEQALSDAPVKRERLRIVEIPEGAG